jgi:hypothetical protein
VAMTMTKMMTMAVVMMTFMKLMKMTMKAMTTN